MIEDKRSVEFGEIGDLRKSKSPHKNANNSREKESTFVSLAKLKERMIQKSIKENTLIYRKVIKMKGGQKNVMISALK
jgi:hypothetical protein